MFCRIYHTCQILLFLSSRKCLNSQFSYYSSVADVVETKSCPCAPLANLRLIESLRKIDDLPCIFHCSVNLYFPPHPHSIPLSFHSALPPSGSPTLPPYHSLWREGEWEGRRAVGNLKTKKDHQKTNYTKENILRIILTICVIGRINDQSKKTHNSPNTSRIQGR